MARDHINPHSGRLVRKDPITGCEVLSSLDPEMLEMMGRVYVEMDKESEEEARRYLTDTKYAQQFVDEAVGEDFTIPLRVKKVINASVGQTMNESSTEIIFEEERTGKKYIASCWHSYGSFYEPPDGGCEVEDLQAKVTGMEGYIDRFIHGPVGMKNVKIPPKEAEIQRRKAILSREINTVNKLRKFL